MMRDNPGKASETRPQVEQAERALKRGFALILFVTLLAGCSQPAQILLMEPSSGKIVACETERCAGQIEATGYRRLSPQEAAKFRSTTRK